MSRADHVQFHVRSAWNKGHMRSLFPGIEIKTPTEFA